MTNSDDGTSAADVSGEIRVALTVGDARVALLETAPAEELEELVGRLADEGAAEIIPQCVPVLERRLADPQSAMRRAALLGLAWLEAGGRHAAERLLADEAAQVRRTAAEILGELSGVDAQEALERGSRDHDPGVRAAVATSLAALGEPESLSALRRMAADEDERVRTAAELALASLRSGTLEEA